MLFQSSVTEHIFFFKYFNCGAYSYLHLGMDVKWFKKQMLNLIEQHELHKCPWNIMTKDYKNQNNRKDAWQEISFHVGIDADIVEKRMRSLPAQYRCNRRKVAENKKSGSGADDTKVPKWFAYQRLKFVDGINKPRKTKESEVISFTLIDFL
jgi:hypothetical protein